MVTIWRPDPFPTEGPAYLGIARALEADIRGGVLDPGDRLPTHRDLADVLGVNVGTVSRAYAECERRGWIRGEVGRGTFVRSGVGSAVGERFARPGGEAPAGGTAQPVDLSLNFPVDPADSDGPDLARALRLLASEVEASGQDWLGYRGPEGGLSDREAGAQALALHGVAVGAHSVVLAAGAQHGLSVALAAACRPGEVVAAEQLSYPGLRACAEARGLRIVPVAMDEGGVVPDAFEQVCAAQRPRALYLSPTLQNPTGTTLDIERRQRIVEIADRHECWIVEDDVHRMLAPDAPPPLAALAPDRVVFVAGLSKSLAPSLRVAFLAVPDALRERLVDQVWNSLWMVSPITAAIASAWVRDGTLERMAAGRRAEAVARQELAADVLAGLPPDFHLGPVSGAYHLWLRLAEPWKATAFANAARARGVVVTPAEAFHLGPGPPPCAVRISLSGARDRAQLADALEILVQVGSADVPSALPRVRL